VSSIRRFEENTGQWPMDIRFVARTPRGALVLGSADARLRLRDADGRATAVGLRWDGAARVAGPEGPAYSTIAGVDRLPGVSNYLTGSDREGWRTNVAGFSRVRYSEVASHVDLEFYGATDGFEYDVVVRPGGDPAALTLRLDGVSAARVDADGGIVLETSAGTFRQHRPIAFQERDGVRTPVDTRYELHDGRIAFRTGAYDRSRPLVIDPTFAFSTYLGGSGTDRGNAVKTDAAGNIYVAGTTFSPDFPVASPLFLDGTNGDAFLAKFTPDGASLVYATYFGGTGTDEANDLAVTPDGSAFIAGSTTSTNLPMVAAFQGAKAGTTDGFLARFAPDGASLVFSTYFGGTDTESIAGVAIDGSAAAYVTGGTISHDVPLKSAFQTTPGGSFIAKFTAAGSLVYSTYFGAAGDPSTFAAPFPVVLHTIAVDAGGVVYVGGDTRGGAIPVTAGAYQSSPAAGSCLDFSNQPIPCQSGVVAKLSTSGTPLYATYLYGVPQPDSTADVVSSITADAQGHAYVLGATWSPNFPTTPGAAREACDCVWPRLFVAELDATGSGLLFSATLGRQTSGTSTGNGAIAVDKFGRTSIAAWTNATDLPLVNPHQSQMGSPSLFKLTNAGVDATPLNPFPGWNATAMAVAADGALYVRLASGFLERMSKSTDGGATWTSVLPALGRGLSADPNDAAQLYTADAKSVSNGWMGFGTTLASPPKGRPGAPGVLFGIDLLGGGVVKSVNGGVSWTPSGTGITTVVKDLVIAPSNPDVMYAMSSGSTPTVYVSVNGGMSWTPHAFPQTSLTSLAVNPTQPSVVYATGHGAWKSIDSGVTWTTLFPTTSTFFTEKSQVVAPTSTTIFLLNPVIEDGLYASTNAGATWTLVHPFPNGGSMVFGPALPGALFVVTTPVPDGMIVTLSTTGAVLYESYLGGDSVDMPNGVTAAPDGSLVIAGWTTSTNFPRASAFQPAFAGVLDTFVTKLRVPQVFFDVEAPLPGATMLMPFTLGGWALDHGATTGNGIDGIDVWAFPAAGGTPTFVGSIAPNVSRPDIAAVYGSGFANAGFNLTVTGLAPGAYTFAIYPHSSITNTFAAPRVMAITLTREDARVTIDVPSSGGTTYGGGTLGGWAIHRGAAAGTGVSTVHVYAYPNPGSGQPPIFLGVATYGVARPDVGAIFGSQFTNSGYNLTLPPLAPGPYLFVAFPFSTATNSFQAPATVLATAGAGQPFGSVDLPASNAIVGTSFTVAGWAIDRAAPAGTGVSAVHVYAFAAGSSTPIFLGVATLGIARPDVGAVFGSPFTPSGYSLTASLPPGTYDVYTYARSTVTGDTAVRGVHIIVQ